MRVPRSNTWAVGVPSAASTSRSPLSSQGSDLVLADVEVRQPVLLARGGVHQRVAREELVGPRAVAEEDQAVVGDPVEVLPVVGVEVLVGVRRQLADVGPLDGSAGVGEVDDRPVRPRDPRGGRVGCARGEPGQRGDRDGTGREGSAAHDARAPHPHAAPSDAEDSPEVIGLPGRSIGCLVHHPAQIVHETAPGASSSRDESFNMDRRENSAREVWLLTVPSLHPSSAAVSVTERSSK